MNKTPVSTDNALSFATYAHEVFVVIPAYNESRMLASVVDSLIPLGCSLVIVDDGSSDSTIESVLSNSCVVLRHIVNRGQGASLQTGITYAVRNGAQYIVTYDADGQHCVDDIPRLVDEVRSGTVEVALGSRFLGLAKNMPAKKWLLLKCAIFFTWIFSGVRLSDVHNGFRVFSRAAAEQLNLRCDRMAHASEIIDQVKASGMPFKEFPVTITYTDYSQEKAHGVWSAFRIMGHYLMRRIVR